jgi:L-ascorbate metabolism protein UlaG (beta-lactamase superfamily)
MLRPPMTGPPSSDDLFRPHFRAGRFYCPWGLPRRSPLDVVRWQSRRAPARGRRVTGPHAAPPDGALLTRFAERPTLHWAGHASSLLHEGDVLAAIDPHFGPRALLPRRQRPPGVPVESLGAARVGLISHNHYDHLDAWTLRRLPRAMTWLVPLGLRGTVSRFGFAEVRELDWWQAVEVAGWRFTLLPAQHWSRRLSQPENSTLWGSWLVETRTARVFFAGDTGYFHGFAEYGRRFGGFDLAVLPIGAYQPRWFMAPVHMDPAEALRATRDLAARRLVPVHWGTFDLSDEGVDEPPRELLRQLDKAENADLRDAVRVLPTGGSLEL